MKVVPLGASCILTLATSTYGVSHGVLLYSHALYLVLNIGKSCISYDFSISRIVHNIFIYLCDSIPQSPNISQYMLLQGGFGLKCNKRQLETSK